NGVSRVFTCRPRGADHRLASWRRRGLQFARHQSSGARDGESESRTFLEYRAEPDGRRDSNWIELPDRLVSADNAGGRNSVSSGVLLADAQDPASCETSSWRCRKPRGRLTS